ncbi:enoyl-CoA hydratase/isomerase family protein [Limimaricola cinnabarinus]|uniref:enoyl-CoA hydratase/isomerase family protein n=1 Tax=Limimaricola cinnabarinus TaxID=1125964 RepID=UPI00248FC7B5|nr:enoyl-CoA hydratase/isomerase family protein [Limimaricola cinnabarinus]
MAMQGEMISARTVDGIARITLDSKPGNALDAATRQALAAALDEIEAALDTAQPPRGVVLTGANGLFSVGLDLRGLDRPVEGPDLATICRRIELLPIPVVAALSGSAIGGGAELALAAHYRLAAPNARIGLPDVVLGLPPGAGGGQRLAALCGVETALDLLLRGRPVTASVAREAGLIDGIVETDLLESAQALVEQLAAAGIRPRPVAGRRERMADGAEWLGCLRRRREMIANAPLRSAARILDSIEAALLLPAPAALRFERTAHADALADPQFRALRYVYFAERRIPAALLAREAGRAVPTAVGRGLLAALMRGSDGLTGRRRLAAIVAQGARLLAAGRVARSADLDALAVHGLGWSRLSGGPFFEARQIGFGALVERMQHWSREEPVFDVPPLLRAALENDDDIDAALRRGRAGAVRTG